MKKSKKSKVIDRQLKNEPVEVKTIIEIAIGVLAFFVAIYLIFSILTGEIKLKKDGDKEVTIQYSEILAEQTFKQNESDYFVLYYDFSSGDVALIDAINSKLSQTATVYRVDLSKNFNKNYISDSKLNTSPANISALKVNHPTLVRLSNNKVVKFVNGLNNIKTYSLNLK